MVRVSRKWALLRGLAGPTIALSLALAPTAAPAWEIALEPLVLSDKGAADRQENLPTGTRASIGDQGLINLIEQGNPASRRSALLPDVVLPSGQDVLTQSSDQLLRMTLAADAPPTDWRSIQVAAHPSAGPGKTTGNRSLAFQFDQETSRLTTDALDGERLLLTLRERGTQQFASMVLPRIGDDDGVRVFADGEVGMDAIRRIDIPLGGSDILRKIANLPVAVAQATRIDAVAAAWLLAAGALGLALLSRRGSRRA